MGFRVGRNAGIFRKRAAPALRSCPGRTLESPDFPIFSGIVTNPSVSAVMPPPFEVLLDAVMLFYSLDAVTTGAVV